jgi:hypothetical protein
MLTWTGSRNNIRKRMAPERVEADEDGNLEQKIQRLVGNEEEQLYMCINIAC